MRWFKKKVVEKVVSEKATLTVYFDKMRTLTLSTPIKAGMRKTDPYRDFYKWWFGRDSKCFVARYNGGETAILRSDIVGFNVSVA